jgi:hypothetical protein
MHSFIGPEAIAVQESADLADQTLTAQNVDLEVWEHYIESEVDRDLSFTPAEKEALITTRRGQGLFKQRVMEIERQLAPERKCSGACRPRLILASTSG